MVATALEAVLGAAPSANVCATRPKPVRYKVMASPACSGRALPAKPPSAYCASSMVTLASVRSTKAIEIPTSVKLKGWLWAANCL
jgi:hypothetical protein